MFKTTTPILLEADTLKFIKQIDLACKLLDPEFLNEVVQRFKLENLEDSPEFLQDARGKLLTWRDNEPGLQITEVEEFTTRCIACVYGKTVNGYRIHYSIPGPGKSRIHYAREIAVNFQLNKGRLTDFGWCNAFLNPEEMDQLKTGPE